MDRLTSYWLADQADGLEDAWMESTVRDRLIDAQHTWFDYAMAERNAKEEIKAESNKDDSNWKDYKLKGGSDYRELIFKLPNATYTNSAMQTHWKDKGVIAHTRLQDMKTESGKRMLFIEEIQSDWHNEGHKKGYSTVDVQALNRARRDADRALMQAQKEVIQNEQYNLIRMASAISNWYESHGRYANEIVVQDDIVHDPGRIYQKYAFDMNSAESTNGFEEAIGEGLLNWFDSWYNKYTELNNAYREARNEANKYKDTVPEAPFKETYTDFVLKRLLRMAAEQGYDSIGWTTAEQQLNRWNKERNTNEWFRNRGYAVEFKEGSENETAFEKGYQKEYDHDIPKFLGKFGKQWGVSVGSDILKSSGEEVWSLPITAAMRESVLYEGQALYSQRVSNRNLKDADDTAIYVRNTDKVNYISKILNGKKTYETRSTNSLKQFAGTGREYALTDGEYIYGYITLGEPVKVSAEDFHKPMWQKRHLVPKGDTYDVKDGGSKYCYPIESYRRVPKKSLSSSSDYNYSYQARQMLFSERQSELTPETLAWAEKKYLTEMENRIGSAKLTYVERLARAELADAQKIYTLEETLKEFKSKQKYIDWWTKQIHENDLAELEDSLEDYYQKKISEKELKAKQREFELKNEIKDLKQKNAYKMWWIDRINRMEKAEMKRGFAEKRAVDYYKPRIERVTAELAKRLLHPDAKTVIPEAVGKSLSTFLSSIDFSTYDKYGNVRSGKANQKRADLRIALADLGTKLSENSLESMYGQLDISPDMFEWIKDIEQYFVEFAQANDGAEFSVNKMNSEQLDTLYKLLRSLRASVNKIGRMYTNMSSDIYDVAQATREHLEPLTGRKHNKYAEKAGEVFAWNYAQPVTVFERFGEGGKTIFKTLIDGQTKQARNMAEVSAFIETAYTEKEVREWRDNTVPVVIDGKTYNVQISQLMGLYCLLNQEDSRRHILEGGGIRFADVESGSAVTRFGNTFLSLDEAEAIVAKLTDRQKEVAKELQQYMSSVGSAWGNEISMTRFGYHAFGVENYYPIHTVAGGSKYEAQQRRANIYALLNKSFTKERNIHANNAVIVEDIFEVFANHMSEMALYNAWALPVIDTIKWFNYKEHQDIETGTPEWSIHDIFRQAYGENADKYVRQLLESINGQYNGGLSEGIAFFNSNVVNRVAVAGNIRVAIQQPFSITRALDELDAKYVKGVKLKDYKATYDEMLENSGFALWKSQGYYGVDTKRPFETEVYKNARFADKFSEKSMALAETGDNVTWVTLWNSCKNEVKATRQFDTEAEMLQLTADRFNELVTKTQVVDSVLTKSQWMRQKSYWYRMTSAFMSEPQTTYNTLLRKYDAWSREAQINGAAKATAKMGKGIARTVAVYCLTQLVNAMVTAPLDAMRDDDDYKTFLEKLWEKFKSNLADNLNPFGLMPYIKDVLEYMQYGKSSRSDLGIAMSAYDIYKKIEAVIDGYTPHKMNALIMSTLKVTSYATGLPISNMFRDVISIYNTVVGGINYGSLKFQTADDSNSVAYKNIWKSMRSGNDKRVAYLYAQMLSNSVDPDTIYSGIGKQIMTAYESGDISRAEATKYLKQIVDMCGKDVTDNDIYWRLDKEDYKIENGSTDGYQKYDEFYSAVSSGVDLKKVIKTYTDNGVKAKTLASEITSHFKPIYLAASKAERARLKGYLLNAYVALGYDRAKKSKDIDEWEKQKK